jgi:hypothetical protein
MVCLDLSERGNHLLICLCAGFQSRTDAEQRQLGEEYANLNTANAHDAFVTKSMLRVGQSWPNCPTLT